MSYTDPRFQVRPLTMVGVITGTATASGTNAVTNASLNMAPPAFVRKTKINTIRVEPGIATPANWTLKLIAKNGTDAMGTSAALGTGTFGQVFDITCTSNTFAAGVAPTFILDGTSTASGQSLGTFNVFMEAQELHA